MIVNPLRAKPVLALGTKSDSDCAHLKKKKKIAKVAKKSFFNCNMSYLCMDIAHTGGGAPVLGGNTVPSGHSG